MPGRDSTVVAALSGTRTIVVIAHRVSTVREMETLHYFEHGRLVASGTFARQAAICESSRSSLREYAVGSLAGTDADEAAVVVEPAAVGETAVVVEPAAADQSIGNQWWLFATARAGAEPPLPSPAHRTRDALR